MQKDVEITFNLEIALGTSVVNNKLWLVFIIQGLRDNEMDLMEAHVVPSLASNLSIAPDP